MGVDRALQGGDHGVWHDEVLSSMIDTRGLACEWGYRYKGALGMLSVIDGEERFRILGVYWSECEL